MSDATGRRLVMSMWVVSFMLIAWESWNGTKSGPSAKATGQTLFPQPVRLVKTSVAFTLLALLSEFAAPLAGILAVGLAVAVSQNAFQLEYPTGSPQNPASDANAGTAGALGSTVSTVGAGATSALTLL